MKTLSLLFTSLTLFTGLLTKAQASWTFQWPVSKEQHSLLIGLRDKEKLSAEEENKLKDHFPKVYPAKKWKDSKELLTALTQSHGLFPCSLGGLKRLPSLILIPEVHTDPDSMDLNAEIRKKYKGSKDTRLFLENILNSQTTNPRGLEDAFVLSASMMVYSHFTWLSEKEASKIDSMLDLFERAEQAPLFKKTLSELKELPKTENPDLIKALQELVQKNSDPERLKVLKKIYPTFKSKDHAQFKDFLKAYAEIVHMAMENPEFKLTYPGIDLTKEFIVRAVLLKEMEENGFKKVGKDQELFRNKLALHLRNEAFLRTFSQDLCSGGTDADQYVWILGAAHVVPFYKLLKKTLDREGLKLEIKLDPRPQEFKWFKNYPKEKKDPLLDLQAELKAP